MDSSNTRISADDPNERVVGPPIKGGWSQTRAF
jgi:hypothetical protein